MWIRYHFISSGLSRAAMSALLLLVSLLLDTVMSANEDGDTVQMKHFKHPYHVERGLRMTEDFLGVPVPLDNLFEQILSLPTDDQGQNVEPECVGGSELSEMDMCLTASQATMFYSLGGFAGKRSRRQASVNRISLWKNGVIPYLFNSTLPPQDREAILGAMSEWEKASCVRFRPATRDDRNVVVFRDGRRCSTNIGCIGGQQTITLARSCRSKRILIHELGHVIGLIHEHQRHDRDKYVTVLLENVRNVSQERYQFSKLLSGSITEKVVAYDYTSIMHYGRNYFAKSPELTTLYTTERAYQDVIGRAERPSFSDTETVNRLYQCSAGCPLSAQCSNYCYLDNVCACRCPPMADKAFFNGRSQYVNHIQDSTCDLLASRGECAGSLKSTVRPLCARSCEQHEISHGIPSLELWTSAPGSNTNHLQSKPASSFWGTSPDIHPSLTSARSGMNFHASEPMNLNDAQLPHLTPQQPASQSHQFLQLVNIHDLPSFLASNMDYRNSLSGGDLRALLQRQMPHRSSGQSLLHSFISGSSSHGKRLFNNALVNNRSQQTSKTPTRSNSDFLSRKETTKAPSIFLDHLLISVQRGISNIKHYPFTGVSFWLNLTDLHRQGRRQNPHQLLQEVPRGISQAPFTVSKNGQQLQHSVYDLAQFRAATTLTNTESAHWQVSHDQTHRSSEANVVNSQAVEVRTGVLPDPYYQGGPSAGASDLQQTTLGFELATAGMEPGTAGMEPATLTSVMSFTGPDNGPSEAGAPGTANSTVVEPANGQDTPASGQALVQYTILPQMFTVSEQNPSSGGNVEQVLNEPWNPQIQQNAPVTEQQLGETVQPLQPVQPAQSPNTASTQGNQPELLGRKEGASNHGAPPPIHPPLVEGLYFHGQQLPLDQHPVSESASSSSQTAINNRYAFPTDSGGQTGNTELHQEQQQTPSLQPINLQQSFTDPLASKGSEALNVVSSGKLNAPSKLQLSENHGNMKQTNSIHHKISHIQNNVMFSNRGLPPINTESSNVPHNLDIMPPQIDTVNGFLQDFSPNSQDYLVSGLDLGTGYLDLISGLSTHTFQSELQNSATSQHRDSYVIPTQTKDFGVQNINSLQKQWGHHSTQTGDQGQHLSHTDPRDHGHGQVVEENNGFIPQQQQQTEEISSQTFSGINDISPSLSLDTVVQETRV